MKTILRRILGFTLCIVYAVSGAMAFPMMVVFMGIDRTIEKLDDLMSHPIKMTE